MIISGTTIIIWSIKRNRCKSDCHVKCQKHQRHQRGDRFKLKEQLSPKKILFSFTNPCAFPNFIRLRNRKRNEAECLNLSYTQYTFEKISSYNLRSYKTADGEEQTETKKYTHAHLPDCIDFCLGMTFK